MHTISDVHNGETFLTHAQIQESFGNVISVVQYNSLISSIPNSWEVMIRSSNVMPGQLKYEYITEFQKLSKIICDELIKNELLLKPVVQKWHKYMFVSYSDVVNACTNISRITSIKKYRSFQYRLLQQAILLNDKLYHMMVVPSQLCTFCGRIKEDVKHFSGTVSMQKNSGVT